MTEDNKNIGMNMTNKDLKIEDKAQDNDNEIDYKEIGIDRVSDDIYKYTNKGKVHEFDLSLLSKEERKRFDKLSNKEKQRLIASVELQQMPSMFDEISLKSVVYPDPDSNITDIQAAAAKYNDLNNLINNDAAFKQMKFSYLKNEDIQKYIINNCPNITQYDIDLLIKLKPDITIHQFMNYFKNIMNDKNLVELNKIQKQLKNPYSDESLKQILNDSENYDAKLLDLLVKNNFSKLDEIYNQLNLVLNHEGFTSEDVAKYIGVEQNKNLPNLSDQGKKRLKNGMRILSLIRKDINKASENLVPLLNSVGLKINNENEMKNIIYNKSTYDELQKLITEKMWNEIVYRFKSTIGIDATSDERQKIMTENRKEHEEERKKEKQGMIRDTQEEIVMAADKEEEMENDIVSSINPSSYPALPAPETKNTNNSSIPQIISFDHNAKNTPVESKPIDKARDELWSAIYKRNEEILKECDSPGEKYLKPGYIMYIQSSNGDLIHLFIRYKRNSRLRGYDYNKSNMYETIKRAVKNGENLDLIVMEADENQSSKRTSVGKYLNQSIVDAMKKAIELGGSIFSRIKNTFKAPEEIRETKMKLSELSEKTVENNKSLRELEKTIEELTNRVNELSKQVGKSYVDRKINKPSFLNDITKPQILKPVEKPATKPVVPQENPDSMESQIRRKLEERRKDLEPSEESEEESEEDWGGKIKIESSDTRKPIPMSDFFKKYL